MYITQRFDNIGARNDGTAAISGGAAVTAVVAPQNANRQAVLICNHSLTDPIWFKLTGSGVTTPPTISASSKDGIIPLNDFLPISAGPGVKIWLISSHAGNTAAFTAVELK